MNVLTQFYRTTVGKKVAMALSGFVLVGFVIAHMIGNLKMFTGIDPETGLYKADVYAAFLREMGSHLLGYSTLLWIARIVLIASVVIHAASGIQLARLNRSAKPRTSRDPDYRFSNAASRSMLFGGLFLMFFIVYHLLHLTFGVAYGQGFEEGKVYSNVVLGFRNPAVTGVYVVAMAFLMLHLYHGAWSMFQTLGANSPRWNAPLRLSAKAIALVLFLGFCSVPVASLTGILPPPPAHSASVHPKG